MVKKLNKTREFFNYLEQTSLSDDEKKHLMSIFAYLNGDCPQIFANRIFLFEGEPGIGKTFLAKKLISSTDKPVVFLGQTQISDNVQRAKDIKELLKVLEEFNEGIIYIDDLRYIFSFTEFNDLSNLDRKRFMKVLEFFKDNNRKTVLIMTLNDSDFMDDSWKDRIDVHLSFKFPSNENKLSFLKETFSSYVNFKELSYLSENTIGYNYRDLPQLVKIAYNLSNKKIDINSIQEALRIYTPSGLSGFKIKLGIKIKLDDLFLKDEFKKELKRIHLTIEKRKEFMENNSVRTNFLIFEGPSGTGKTYSALALAGEMGIPLVQISVREFFGKRFGIEGIFDCIKRFQNTIILIDDADKIVEGEAFSINDGGKFNADLNFHLDNLDKSALVILSVNDSRRLGVSLRERFKIIKFEHPGVGERELYFNKVIKKSKINFNISESDFAEVTEGMNYRDIHRLWNECIFFAIENNLKILEKKDLLSISRRNVENKPRSSMFG